MKFSIGQRVCYCSGIYSHILKGNSGIIVGQAPYDSTRNVLNVDWDKEFADGHTCSGLARKHHGWNVLDTDCELVDTVMNISEFI